MKIHTTGYKTLYGVGFCLQPFRSSKKNNEKFENPYTPQPTITEAIYGNPDQNRNDKNERK